VSHKFNFDFVPFSRDAIVEMSSDDLHRQIGKIKRMIREARSQGRDTELYEVEFCYLDHERQMRQRYEKPTPISPQRFKGGNS